MDYRFYLRDPKTETDYTEIDEPDGWDAVTFTIQRSDAYTGLENSYSDTLTFVDAGAAYLQAKFAIYLFDALLDFKYEYYCNGVLIDTYFGAINMMTYSEINNEVSVKIEESSFSRKILNRIETIIDLQAEESIEGEALTPLDPVMLPLHSKNILLTGRLGLNEALADYEEVGVNDEGFNGLYFPLQVLSDEYETIEEVPIIFDLNASLPYGGYKIFQAPIAGDYTFDYDLRGTLFESTGGARQFEYGIQFVNSMGGIAGGAITTIRPASFHNDTGGTITIPYSNTGTVTLTLNTNENVYLFSSMFNSTPSRSATIRQLITVATLKISSKSVYASSSAPAYMIYEALNRVVESISDTTDAIRSDFFGRTNSSPQAYASDGCGCSQVRLSGKALRRIIDVDGNFATTSFSFKELFDDLDAQFSIGFRIESDGEKQYMRIEPKEYFYNYESVMQFANVSDIKTSISTKDIYNNFEVGYTEWQIEEINGIDEINTKHQYTIPITTGSNKLSKISPFIAGGYAIEYTRRQQFKTTPTTDWRYDDNIFIICLSKIDQTFESAEEDPYFYIGNGITYPHTYLKNTVPERNEAFTYVTNYFSPETAYNLRISPVRMALNWHPILATSTTQAPEKPVKFQSGEGNIDESDVLIDGCQPIIGEVFQKQDLLRSDFENYKKEAFFKPILHVFTYPGTMTDFRFLRLNSNKSIEFSCGNSNFIPGFIKELSFEPNSEDGGILNFTVLEGFCTFGAFDDSFDESFDIGTC